MAPCQLTENMTTRRQEKEIKVRVIRSISELEGIRNIWMSWQSHPNSDITFYLNILCSRPEFVRPHVIVIYRNECPEAILVGRVEHGSLNLRLGYGRLFSPKVTLLAFGYGCVLGRPSSEGSDLAIREV